MGDPPGDTKSMYDVVVEEVNNVGSFNFSERHDFYPLGKVISYSKDKLMTFHRWRTDGSYNIDLHALNGHEVTVGWSSSGGWYMKSVWI